MKKLIPVICLFLICSLTANAERYTVITTTLVDGEFADEDLNTLTVTCNPSDELCCMQYVVLSGNDNVLNQGEDVQVLVYDSNGANPHVFAEGVFDYVELTPTETGFSAQIGLMIE